MMNLMDHLEYPDQYIFLAHQDLFVDLDCYEVDLIKLEHVLAANCICILKKKGIKFRLIAC